MMQPWVFGPQPPPSDASSSSRASPPRGPRTRPAGRRAPDGTWVAALEPPGPRNSIRKAGIGTASAIPPTPVSTPIQSPSISGYRWRYTLGASAGAHYEFVLGRFFDHFRLEFALAQRRNDLNQMFRGISYLDGTPIGDRAGGPVVSNAQTSIDHLQVRTLALQAYYDFPVASSPIVPYLGIGAGPAFATVSGVRFSTRYEDTSAEAPEYDPPLSFYDRPPGRRPLRHGPGRPSARRSRLPAQRPHTAGCACELLDAGRGGSHRRLLLAPLACAGPGVSQPQPGQRGPRLDAGADLQTAFRKISDRVQGLGQASVPASDGRTRGRRLTGQAANRT